MQKITSLPADDVLPGWYHTSPSRIPRPAHVGQKHARWAIVGAGLTGLATARQMALNFPDDEIVLIEAQEIGYGSSGRNAGFAIDVPHDIGAKDYIGDVKTASLILKLNTLGQNYLRSIVQEHGIECQMSEAGKYQAAVGEQGIAILEAYRSGLAKIGRETEMIAGQDLPDHIGTSYYKQALYIPGTILLQPSALVKGLAESLPPNVTLYEYTPITAINYGVKVTLVHDKGSITADKLILANNAFASHFGFLRGRLLPTFLYGSLTRPLTSDEQAQLGGKPVWGVIPAHPFGSTVRRTVDNRILVRNSFSFHPDGRPREHHLKNFIANHRKSFERRFPKLNRVDFEYSWSGAICLSENHEGFFGQLAPNVYGALCCNGLGITRGTATGKLLADMIMGERNDLIDFLVASPGPNKTAPEPFLSIGVNSVLKWGQYRAGLEV
ncbi:FAD-binding oxidoreductase [Salmonella enterica]|uniref:NAD(P)/FAD-dependent oxidoreductase n=1 Tax=Enterobacterales TaxID=91347 RepID=UPI00069CE55B|nr:MULTISPECIES: FAD-binding oxidoreductase [Enterobacterales]EBA4351871.1 FAD-binding oxidoreductase [Salmonella enterica]EDC0921293.1 FAD-binding oxidoreductase [Salmonella enterica subsp. enterica serovar Montevideo]EDL7998739.1 FAD-dependent oxidoreductase [Salmonella enterica subsp. enterica serovar Rubislaw]EDW1680399.1 FAD-binding oxidoreductase [Salmonella enterica subsp. enterica serovar Bredeney]EEH4938994.1 FAD-binding oxidoreductase [Salmonella enterica subsp. enterica serovar Agon